jgi:hemolysin type calcium-binding protein
MLFAALVWPAGATAGTAKLTKNPPMERIDPSEEFSYTAAPGEVNRLTLSEAPGGGVLVVDTAGVTLGRGCLRPVAGDNTRARCRSPEGLPINGGGATLGDGDDVATDTATTTAVGTSLSGGPGNDRLTGGTVDGGDGNDVIKGDGIIKGGKGNDVMTGSGGAGYDSFDESEPNNGSDTINGGGGETNIVDYTKRTKPVHVDFEGDRDDGEAGENDQLSKDMDSADGGRGNDVFAGNARSNIFSGYSGADRLTGAGGDDVLYAYNIIGPGPGKPADTLDGGAGDDRLEGSNGPNRLKPGSGQDDVASFGGNDRVPARDRSIDILRCGKGRDTLKLDVRDFFGRGCERVRRKGLPGGIPVAAYTLAQSDEGPFVEIACPYDGPRICRGRTRVTYKGKTVGRKKFKARRRRKAFVEFPKLGRLEFKNIKIVVRSRNRRGKLRVVTRRDDLDRQG